MKANDDNEFTEVDSDSDGGRKGRRPTGLLLLSILLFVAVAVLAIVAYCTFRRKAAITTREYITQYITTNSTDALVSEFVEVIKSIIK